MATNLKGKKILKIAGGFAVFLGFIAAFAGFFVMATNMTTVSADAENASQQLQSMRYTNLLGMYIIVYGIYICIAGFIGVINSDNPEYVKKCFNYGFIFVGLSIVNVIIMAIIGNIFAILSMIITGIPLFVSLFYIIGAFLNVKSTKDLM